MTKDRTEEVSNVKHNENQHLMILVTGKNECKACQSDPVWVAFEKRFNEQKQKQHADAD